MKKVTKLLAVLLALVLIIGAIPVSAASTDVKLKKEKKTLYLGGCKGTKSNGKKAKFYEYLNVKKIVENYDSKTMEFVLEVNEDKGKLNTGEVTTNNSKGRITAKAVGTVYVTVTVRKKSTQKPLLSRDVKITVNKNADKDFTVKGIKDGGEYEVGEKLTVTMARSNDTDYRELLSDDAGVTLTKKTTKGTKYVVNFEKAGTYTIKARTYQSNTYKGTTAEKTFKVTVTGGAEPTTTPEPTPTPTAEPTATPTPTEAPVGDLGIKQTELKTFVISGVKDASNVKKTDVSVYTVIANTGTEINFGAVKNVSAKDNDLTVQMFSVFEADTTYYVKVSGVTEKPLSFTGANYRKEDIAKIGITNTNVLYGEKADLGIRYYDANGVDITEKVETQVVPTIKTKQGVTDAYVSGTKVKFLAPNKKCDFEITVTIGYKNYIEPITITNTFTVSSFEPQSTGFIYTVTKDDGAYMKKDDKVETGFALKDSVVIEALFLYDDNTVKTLAERGVDYVDTNNKEVLMIGAKSATGGYYLIANNEGEATVLFYKGGHNGELVGTADVTVKAQKQPVAIAAKLSKNFLNVNPGADDSLEITVTIMDQYGNAISGQPITISQTDGTKEVTGKASFGGFVNEKLTVKGTNIILNSGETDGPIGATISSGNLTTDVLFYVANYDKAEDYVVTSNPEGANILMKTGILPGDAKPSVVTMGVEGINYQYHVTNESLKFLGKTISPAMKASEFGIANGTKAYFFTISKDGKILESLPSALITTSSGKISFKAFDNQTKLEAGNYLVEFYEVIGGAEDSEVLPIGNRVVTVVDDQLVPEINKKAEKSTKATDLDAFNECFEVILGDKKVDASAIKAVTANKDQSDGSRYFLTVTILIHNDIYGDYVKEYAVTDGLIK